MLKVVISIDPLHHGWSSNVPCPSESNLVTAEHLGTLSLYVTTSPSWICLCFIFLCTDCPTIDICNGYDFVEVAYFSGSPVLHKHRTDMFFLERGLKEKSFSMWIKSGCVLRSTQNINLVPQIWLPLNMTAPRIHNIYKWTARSTLDRNNTQNARTKFGNVTHWTFNLIPNYPWCILQWHNICHNESKMSIWEMSVKIKICL